MSGHETIQEKAPFQSKKFWAYLLAEGTWKVIAFVTIWLGFKNGHIENSVAFILGLVVVIAGFIEAGYILGQASLDKYTRLIQVAANNGKTLKLRGVELGHTSQPPPPPDPTSKPEADG